MVSAHSSFRTKAIYSFTLCSDLSPGSWHQSVRKHKCFNCGFDNESALSTALFPCTIEEKNPDSESATVFGLARALLYLYNEEDHYNKTSKVMVNMLIITSR